MEWEAFIRIGIYVVAGFFALRRRNWFGYAIIIVLVAANLLHALHLNTGMAYELYRIFMALVIATYVARR